MKNDSFNDLNSLVKKRLNRIEFLSYYIEFKNRENDGNNYLKKYLTFFFRYAARVVIRLELALISIF